MKEEIKLPDMGEGVESATVVSIMVSKGDRIEPDQGIVELETDKAVAEVPSPKGGKVVDIHVETDQEVTPGTLLLTVETDGEEEAEKGEQEKPEKEEPSGEGEAETQEPEERPEGKEKAKKKAEEKPPEKPAEKEEPEEKGEADQRQAEEDKPEEPSAEAKAEAAEKEPEERKEAKPAPEGPNVPAPDGVGVARPHEGKFAAGSDVPAGPAVRRLARELGVDLSQVKGSGEGARISEADLFAAVRERNLAAKRQPELAEADKRGPVRREKMSAVRKAISDKMHRSKSLAAHVTHFDDADVTELEQFRKAHKDDLAPEHIKLTMLAFVLRAAADALRDHPLVNASLDLETNEIVYKEYISLGVAVDTERGLMVPVIREVDSKSIGAIAHAVQELTEKARSGKIGPDDMKGGTFTVSNLGAIGGRYATPVINYPEAAILLVGRTRQQPAVYDGQVTIRTMLPLSLSYDHRIVDGAEAQRFLNDVMGYLQSPGRLLTL